MVEAEVEVVEAVAEVVEVALYSPGQDLLPLPHHHHLLADQEAGDYQDQVHLDLKVQVQKRTSFSFLLLLYQS